MSIITQINELTPFSRHPFPSKRLALYDGLDDEARSQFRCPLHDIYNSKTIR
jgi:hypothetical protein